MLIIKGYRYAPLEGGAGYAEIFQPGAQEVIQHLILAGCRLDKIGIFLYMFYEAVLVLGQAEEVAFFLKKLYLPAAVRTVAVLKLVFRRRRYPSASIIP